MQVNRQTLLPGAPLPDVDDLIAQGRQLAARHTIVPGAFLREAGEPSEAAYKRSRARAGLIMQHAQIGWRGFERSRTAWREIYARCRDQGVTIDRYGICLDWSMGLARADRNRAMQGTGLILEDTEQFVSLCEAAPVAPHFGDFVLGFPAAVENTCAALAAGSTSIGNLGQYFTFRLYGADDDVTCTAETVKALALIAAQPETVLVHSNLDDGFAAMFQDLASVLGAVLIEQHIAALCNVTVSHCYGHHFTDPVRRLAFHLALACVSDAPGTMVYGNTTSYRDAGAANFASLAAYLSVDIQAQLACPTGHAINAVPVSENERIPDVDEVIDAQMFAGRHVEHARRQVPLFGTAHAAALAQRLVVAGRAFRDRVFEGFRAGGLDLENPFEVLLAIRRMGGRQLEELYGGPVEVETDIVEEIDAGAMNLLDGLHASERNGLAGSQIRIVTAATDVHEHAKRVMDKVLCGVGLDVIDGGTSADPLQLAHTALDHDADVIAISTYNGIALDYYRQVRKTVGPDLPILIGGRLNQVPASSNTYLPVDVSTELAAEGAVICRSIEDALDTIRTLARTAK